MLNDNSKMQTTKEMSISCIWNVQSIFLSFFFCSFAVALCGTSFIMRHSDFEFVRNLQNGKSVGFATLLF